MDEETSSAIQDAGLEKVKIRSVLTCTSRRGVCAKSYGRPRISQMIAVDNSQPSLERGTHESTSPTRPTSPRVR